MRAKFLFLPLLACLVFTQSLEKFSYYAGFDFYQYWGIHKAQLWTTSRLGNPFADQAQYAEALNAHAEASQDDRLKSVNQMRRTLDPTGTPLFYAAFGFLPENYSFAFALFQTLQILLFVSAVLMLGWLYRCDFFWVCMFALLLAVTYDPFVGDLRVGNINAIQLFAIALLMVFMERLSAAGTSGGEFCRGAALLFALGALVLFKPNLTIIASFLAIHLWVRRGTRAFALAAVAAAALCLALALLPCLSFHSWTIWQDWYQTVFGANHEKLVYPVALGNYAAVLMVSEFLGCSTSTAIAGMAAALALSVALALGWASAKPRLSPRNFWNAAKLSIEDPHLMAAAAIVATLALAPLLWLHYYTLLLLPTLWLLWSQRRWAYADVMGAISLLLIAFQLIFICLGWNALVPYGYALSWAPLWIGIVAEMALQKPAKPDLT